MHSPVAGTRDKARLRYDKLLVVDLEATCWEGPPPAGEESEIIEIGVADLELGTGSIGPARSLMVRPAKSRVSGFCTRLTGITQEDVEAGAPLGRATKQLVRAGARGVVWASWGDFDRAFLASQCERWGVAYPFGGQHLNAKVLHCLHRGLKRPLGLGRALRFEGLAFEGRKHRAGDDAFNAARIMARLLRPGRAPPGAGGAP